MRRYQKTIKQTGKELHALLTKNRSARRSLLLSLLFLLLAVVLPLWRLTPVAQESPFIALHYNIYLGVDRFGPFWQLFLIPALGLGTIVLNLLVQARSRRRNKVLVHIFTYATPLILFVLLAAMSLIVLVNV